MCFVFHGNTVVNINIYYHGFDENFVHNKLSQIINYKTH